MSQHNGPRIKISNVVLYFDIEDYTGTSSWNSKVGSNASVNGTINHRETNLDKFLDLDGSTNYLQLSDYLSSLSEISINAWISPISIASEIEMCALNNMVLSIKPNTSDNTQTDIIWYSNYSGSSKTYTTTITKKTLHTHLAVTQNSSGDVKFYINGELKNSQSGAASLSNTQAYKHIGSLGGSSNFFRGAVSRLIVSGIAESDNEIRNFYKTNTEILKKQTYDTANKAIIAVWNTNTSSGKDAYFLFLYPSIVTSIDWGDGTVGQYTGSGSHTYEEDGTYIVSFGIESLVIYTYPMRSSAARFGWEKILYLLNPLNMLSLSYLPKLKYVPENLKFNGMTIFGSCTELNHPNMVNNVTFQNTNISTLFSECQKFNQPINHWDVSNKIIYGLFNNCSNFNQPLDNWDTSAITNMYAIFQGASVFNQDLSSWDTSSATNMSSMFNNAQCFNQDLSSWDVGNVVDFSFAFRYCYSLGSNANFSGWNTSSATNMRNMFEGCRQFTTPNISGFDTSNVTDMQYMFAGCYKFNEDIGSWNTSKVANMSFVFISCYDFNQNIGNWNTSSVTNMYGMFHQAFSFNQDLSNWDTSNVTSFLYTFYRCGYNKSNLYLGISGWDVSKGTTFNGMLNDCRYFNEDISNWNLAGITATNGLDYFMYQVTLSNTNYDALLNGWNSNKLAASNGVANWRTDLRPHFGNSKYTSAGASARQGLIDYGWTITDGGLQT